MYCKVYCRVVIAILDFNLNFNLVFNFQIQLHSFTVYRLYPGLTTFFTMVLDSPGKSWISLLGIVIFGTMKIFTPVHLNIVEQPSFSVDHWTAPLRGNFTKIDPVSSFHYSIGITRPNLLNPPIIRNRFSIQMLLTILLAGDIEINPGPGRRGPKYPCQICSKAAKWGQKAIECDKCSGWFHISCLDMNDHIYLTLAEHNSNSFGSLEQLPDSFIGDPATLGDPLVSSSPKDYRIPPASKPNLGNKRNSVHKRGYSTKLKIININCQSIRAKLPDFEAMLATEDPDIVVGTESWLTNSVATGEVFPRNYNVFRRDRISTNRGGGFLLQLKHIHCIN